jgi:glycosyltransferase involved in cell wall biosynthesis
MEVVGMELVKAIQQLDKSNEYVLFARKDKFTEGLAPTSNFKFQTLRSVTYADWEQVVLPRAITEMKIDLLHCTSNTGPVSSPVPMILTLHDIIYLENLNFKGSNYQNFGNLYRRIVVPRLVEKSALVITVSEFEKRLIRERFQVPEEKVKVLYNGIDERFHIKHRKEALFDFRNRFQLPSEFILFLGNLAPKKNTLNVIKAYIHYCKQHHSILPIVMLDYERERVAAILKEQNSLDCLGNFHFPGYISPLEMPLVYQNASLFLYPSLRESFGMPILESMASGTPVVTSNTSSMPEVAGNAAFYVDPFSYYDISRGITALLNNNTLRHQLIESGYQRAMKFNWGNVANEMIRIYTHYGNA